MYSVIVTKKVHESIKLFIDSYRNTFLELFSDTGIFDEDLIRQHYIQSSEKFQIGIFNLIEDILSSDIVLWRKEIWVNAFEILSQIWNYRLLLEYTEDKKETIRYLKDIKLHKK